MNAHSIFENNFHINNKDLILNYCKLAYQEKSEPSYVNMWDENWGNNTATLPYLLYNSDRFIESKGDMFILRENNKIMALSGINKSDFDNNVAIGGVRTWLNKELRGKFIVGRYLLPLQLKWAKQHNIKTIALTFNDYNKRLIPYFKRTGFGIEKKRNPNSMFYNGLYEVAFPVLINYTKQWAIYDKIDRSYEPDWESIKYIEDK